MNRIAVFLLCVGMAAQTNGDNHCHHIVGVAGELLTDNWAKCGNVMVVPPCSPGMDCTAFIYGEPSESSLDVPAVKPKKAAPKSTFVISDCPKDGTVVHAKDRLWAISNSGCTVWTKKEWDEAQARTSGFGTHEEHTSGVLTQMLPPGFTTLDCIHCEPIDTPALHINPKCSGGCVPPPDYWTCADKSRILEHDENDPPKYWCRKVQP
jgi:hypothetical protein